MAGFSPVLFCLRTGQAIQGSGAYVLGTHYSTASNCCDGKEGMAMVLQVAPSADVATAKNLASCKEFLVEDTYPAPPRPALSCISSASSMTFPAPAATPSSKHDTLKTLASAAERSASHAQHLDSPEGHKSRPGGEQVASSLPGSSGQLTSPFKTDPSRQSGAAGSEISATPLGLSAAQHPVAAVKALLSVGQPDVNGQGQVLGHTSTSKEAGKGAMAARTLMFFKGCPSSLGCTVLLKGAPKSVLASVKKVMEVGFPTQNFLALHPVTSSHKSCRHEIGSNTCLSESHNERVGRCRCWCWCCQLLARSS